MRLFTARAGVLLLNATQLLAESIGKHTNTYQGLPKNHPKRQPTKNIWATITHNSP